MSLFFILLTFAAVVSVIAYCVVKKSDVSHDKKTNVQDSSFEQQANVSQENKRKYSLKRCLMTKSEQEYYFAIKNAIGDEYIVQAQVPLSAIIEKDKSFEGEYQNELYRIIDFGIFTKEFCPLLLVEINDQTHNTTNRRKRDAKVHEICNEAGIPIVTFWTSYGVNSEYIKHRISEKLEEVEILKQTPQLNNFTQEIPLKSEENFESKEEPYSKTKQKICLKLFYVFLALTGLFLLLFALSVLLHGPAWSKAACSVALLLAGCCAFWLKVEESEEKSKRH